MNRTKSLEEILSEIEAIEKRLNRPLPPAPPSPWMSKAPVTQVHKKQLAVLPATATWRVKKFDDVFYGFKGRPIVLRMEHVQEIDRIRKEFNSGRLHGGRDALTSTDVVNSCVDAIFSHPGIPFHLLRDSGDLAQLICDHIHKTAVSYWRRFNEIF